MKQTIVAHAAEVIVRTPDGHEHRWQVQDVCIECYNGDLTGEGAWSRLVATLSGEPR